MRIGMLAELAGVSPRTIDYYTQMGLISEAARSNGKHRLYCEKALQTIKLIKELQKQHYSLEEICALLKEHNQDNLADKMLHIRNTLDQLQTELTSLYPSLQNSGRSGELQAFMREMAGKGTQVMQILLLLMGDPTL